MSWVGVFGALSRIGLQSQADHGPVFRVPVAHPQPMIFRVSPWQHAKIKL